jgi:hypothetical protein
MALSLDRERDKFLCYAREHGLTNVDWSEALKLWLWSAIIVYLRNMQS